jgi:hypothetical protein
LAPRNGDSINYPHRQRADAAKEIRTESLWPAHDFEAQIPVQYFLPENSYLQFGEPVADAAVDAGAGPERRR